MNNKLSGALNASIVHWNSLPSEIFMPIYKKGGKEVILIKFRETMGQRTLFNETEPWEGIKFIDAMGTNDYFIGEFVIIDRRKWKTMITLHSTILFPRISRTQETTEKIRDDGFIKTYRTTNGSLVIAKV